MQVYLPCLAGLHQLPTPAAKVQHSGDPGKQPSPKQSLHSGAPKFYRIWTTYTKQRYPRLNASGRDEQTPLFSNLILQVHICFPLQQQTHYFHVTFPSGPHQCSPKILREAKIKLVFPFEQKKIIPKHLSTNQIGISSCLKHWFHHMQVALITCDCHGRYNALAIACLKLWNEIWIK